VLIKVIRVKIPFAFSRRKKDKKGKKAEAPQGEKP